MDASTKSHPEPPAKDRFGNYSLRMTYPNLLKTLADLDAGVQLVNVSHEWLSVLRAEGWSPEYVGRNEAKEPVYFIRHESSTAPCTFHELPALRPRITSGHMCMFIDGRLVLVDDRTKPRWVLPGGCKTAEDEGDPAATALRELVEETKWLRCIAAQPLVTFKGSRPLLGVKNIEDHCHVFTGEMAINLARPDAREVKTFIAELMTRGSLPLDHNAEIDRVGLLPVPPLPQKEFSSLVQVVAWAKTWPDTHAGKPVSLFARVAGALALSNFKGGNFSGAEVQKAGLARPAANEWWFRGQPSD